MLTIPGSDIKLPADAVETHRTAHADAWWGFMLTVRLNAPTEVVRLARGHRGILGDWFAIRPPFLSPSTFAAMHSIPPGGNEAEVSLKHAGIWQLQRGTVLNVGRCAPLFGQPGGGYQAEYLDGAFPKLLGRVDM